MQIINLKRITSKNCRGNQNSYVEFYDTSDVFEPINVLIRYVDYWDENKKQYYYKTFPKFHPSVYSMVSTEIYSMLHNGSHVQRRYYKDWEMLTEEEFYEKKENLNAK